MREKGGEKGRRRLVHLRSGFLRRRVSRFVVSPLSRSIHSFSSSAGSLREGGDDCIMGRRVERESPRFGSAVWADYCAPSSFPSCTEKGASVTAGSPDVTDGDEEKGENEPDR
jgi:hypothetical protein